jgi:hypothetical protein
VNHPEEHGVDIHRYGIGREGLLGGKARGNRPLIDPHRHVIGEG